MRFAVSAAGAVEAVARSAALLRDNCGASADEIRGQCAELEEYVEAKEAAQKAMARRKAVRLPITASNAECKARERLPRRDLSSSSVRPACQGGASP